MRQALQLQVVPTIAVFVLIAVRNPTVTEGTPPLTLTLVNTVAALSPTIAGSQEPGTALLELLRGKNNKGRLLKQFHVFCS
jgi:hypothetical protein